MYHGVISATLEFLDTDFLIVGAGVAGLRAAIELAVSGSVLVVAKDSLRESSSEYAQGGVAVALSDDDEVELHEADTLAAGDGLCDREAVRTLVEEGPAAIEQLMAWGTEFDREGSKLLFAREGAHSRSRVLHAHGDSTGREMAHSLYRKAASFESVRFLSFSSMVDLMIHDGRVTGAFALDSHGDRLVGIRARAVLLATGGLGRVYAETTNPDVATGDGVAAAWRAGAVISDLEFVQFHPTALHLENAPRFLLSEALRGEGAHLLNSKGERFMQRYHALAELAPRDVVSRCIVEEMHREGSPHVYLDLSNRGPAFVRKRFPRIYETCLAYGLDLDKQAAPVHPAAHYAMGGVWTTLDTRTSVPGLYAAGEVACTGVHGANRLASNSLLEGLVFGARAGRAMADAEAAHEGAQPAWSAPQSSEDAIRSLAWRHCGILRDAAGLRQAIETLEEMPVDTSAPITRAHCELRSMHTVAWMIALCAEARKESRGAHRRTDHPRTLPEYARHSRVSLEHPEVAFV